MDLIPFFQLVAALRICNCLIIQLGFWSGDWFCEATVFGAHEQKCYELSRCDFSRNSGEKATRK